MDLSVIRSLLLNKLQSLNEEEEKVNQELSYHLQQLLGKSNSLPLSSNSTTHSHSGNQIEHINIVEDLDKVKNFEPVYESILQNAKKLSAQVEDCNNLSERLSSIVRKLDLKQIRAKKALSCTEDILSLKDCKHRILQAIEDRNLSVAVSCLRQVHEINEKAAKTSEDYEIIVEKEKEVKEMVRNEFQSAITESNTSKVMSLCPLLQTLGLETEARDNFLSYMEAKVFIGVSADASGVIEGTTITDPSAAYASALSNVFNSTVLIIQQYLPMVIQGLENSLGDIHFIRRLHKKCESEASLVLKRYMKYRGVKDMIGNLKNLSFSSSSASSSSSSAASASGLSSSIATSSSSTTSGGVGNSGSNTSSHAMTQAELHTIMNELALLIQYCCKYLKYLKNVCHGAESKIRSSTSHLPSSSSSSSSSSATTVIVFTGSLEFEKIVEELISKYYMEGEQWLMKGSIENVLPRNIDSYTSLTKSIKLDECFFVLQKCGMRSIASHNIHAASACLTFVSDLITNDLLIQGMELLMNCINKLANIVSECIQRYRRKMTSTDDDSATSTASSSSALSYGLSKGLSSAMSLATTIAGGNTITSTGGDSGASTGDDLIFHEDGTFTVSSFSSSVSSMEDDRWGVATLLEAFNIMELCIRYTERLNKDLYSAASDVFMTDEDELHEQQQQQQSLHSSSLTKPKVSRSRSIGDKKDHHVTTEFDRIKLCKENFDNIRISYMNVSNLVCCCYFLLSFGSLLTASRDGLLPAFCFGFLPCSFSLFFLLISLPVASFCSCSRCFIYFPVCRLLNKLQNVMLQ
jgi:hypothetical protein